MDRRHAACSPAEHRARVARGALGLVLATAASTAAAVAAVVAPFGHRAPAAPTDPAAHAAHLLADAAGGTWEEVADTGSMAPALTARQFAVLTPVDIRVVRTREIVVFRARLPSDPPGSPPRRVVHRVVAVQGCDGVPLHARSPDCVVLRVQGDANARPDVVPVTSANFEGRIAWIVDRADGRVRDVVADPAGRPVRLGAALASVRATRRASQPSGTSLSAYTLAIRWPSHT
jgi:hypothetical protein